MTGLKLIFATAAKIFLASLVFFLAACGGGSSGSIPPVNTNPQPPTAPPSGSEFLYQVAFVNDIQVSTLNTSTGALSSPVDAAPSTIIENLGLPPVATSSGKFFYVQGFCQSCSPPANVIWGFSIVGPNGTLTNLTNSPFLQNTPGLGFTPNGLVMDTQGKFLYASVYEGMNASGNSQNSILIFSIDQSSGELQYNSTFSSTSQAWLSVKAVDPSNKFLYAASALSNGPAISVYSIDSTSGALTEIPGSPFSVVTTPEGVEYNVGIAVSPSGKIVYALLTSETNTAPGIFSFSVDPTTNALTVIPGSPFPVGSPASIIFGSTGSFLFANDLGSTGISVFEVDPVNGTVGPLPSSSTSTPIYSADVLIDPSGQFLVVNDSINTASVFSINASTGALTRVTGSPFPVGSQWESALIVRIK